MNNPTSMRGHYEHCVHAKDKRAIDGVVNLPVGPLSAPRFSVHIRERVALVFTAVSGLG
jgi:hypothetical protein